MHGVGGGEGARAAACRALEFPRARRRRSPLLSSLQGFLMKLYMMIEGFCCEKYR